MAFPRGFRATLADWGCLDVGEVGLDGSETSDWPWVSGMVRVSEAVDCVGWGGGGRGMRFSGGISSAAGTGSPRAAATIWASVHCSSKSFRPLQKGASFRSIYAHAYVNITGTLSALGAWYSQ